MNHLKLSFFGAFQATLGNKPLRNFRSAKVEGLLIYLALNAAQPCARDVLAALFWPDETERMAKQNLRQSLFRLRKVLGDIDSKQEPHLLVTRSTVQFNRNSSYSLDVADFLAALNRGELETAVSLYHNDLLLSFSCDSRPFDEWLRQDRERLHRLALEALHQLTADHLANTDFQKARHYAQQQLILEPWREEAHRQLMQALASLGERTAALAQYETCRSTLAEELGIEPSKETAVLARRIRDAQLVRPSHLQIEPAVQRLNIPFVGRKTEFETLVKAYQQASQLGLQLVTVQGNAGIGKTRLTEQFVTWAVTQGADLLYGRSFQTSSGLSYQPIIHLMRQRIERENAPEDLLSDLWLSQLTRLLPELRDRYPDLPTPTIEENSARQHLFEAVTRLIQALAARQPLVLFIDDWHWADSGSLDLLHYAAVRWSEEKLPILLVLTLRQEVISESDELQRWLDQINHATNHTLLQMGELSQQETTQLIDQLVTSKTDGSDRATQQLTDWLFAETGGQPLFLTETLKALVDDVLVQPVENDSSWGVDWSKFDTQSASGVVLHSIQQIVQSWLARISPEAKGVLTAVSVLAQNATFDHLRHITGLDELDTLNALDGLLEKQLLQEVDTPSILPNPDPVYSFTHQKVSDVVYAEAGTARRRLLHRRTFELLQQLATPAADLAHHALNAGLLAETVHHSLIAGNEALGLFAVRVAIPHYQTIWNLIEQQGWPETISGADKQTLFVNLGRAYELAEEWALAQKIYEAMITEARAMGASAMEWLGLNRLARVFIFFGKDQQQILTLLEKAYAVAEQNEDRLGIAETNSSFAHVTRIYDDLPLARSYTERALRIARELNHPQLIARQLITLSSIHIQRREWEEAEQCALEASQIYADAGYQILASDSLRDVGIAQLMTGKPQEALRTLEETAAFSRQIENFWGETECTWKLAHTHLELGHYGIAFKLLKEAASMTRKLGLSAMIDITAIVASIAYQKIMAFDIAQEKALEVINIAAERPVFEVLLDWAKSELCAAYVLADGLAPCTRGCASAVARVWRRHDGADELVWLV